MTRNDALARAVFLAAAAAIVVGLLVFKVRVAVAGGKYVVLLAVVVLAVWFISKALGRTR
jgi:hypothetical protein